jgi:hypothetical protein
MAKVVEAVGRSLMVESTSVQMVCICMDLARAMHG